MCQLDFCFDKYTPVQQAERIASRPKMQERWIYKMLYRGFISEYIADNAVKMKRRVANES